MEGRTARGAFHTYVTFRDMGAAFAVALFGIDILVVGQFGSFKLPLVVLTPIPLTLISIMLGHWLFGVPLMQKSFTTDDVTIRDVPPTPVAIMEHRGEPAAIAESIRSICSTPVPDDGVIFDIAGIEATPIRDEAEYAGVRVRTNATIAGARIPIQIDVGFGDAITPAALEIEYPSLLDAPPPKLRAYPPETVLAEKTEAIVSLGVANSRMKDFYDLWMVSQTFAFEGKALTDAVQRTFERRRTPWPEQLPTGLSHAFASEKEAQWRAFLARDRLAPAPASLIEVADSLREFLGPVLAREELASWPPGGQWTYLEAEVPPDPTESLFAKKWNPTIRESRPTL